MYKPFLGLQDSKKFIRAESEVIPPFWFPFLVLRGLTLENRPASILIRSSYRV